MDSRERRAAPRPLEQVDTNLKRGHDRDAGVAANEPVKVAQHLRGLCRHSESPYGFSHNAAAVRMSSHSS